MNPEDSKALRLLVSVRSAEEVLVAIAGGADWIDLKEPSDGSLAAVDVKVAREAVAALAGRRMLSAALGELRDWDVGNSDKLLPVAGIGVVKLGLANCAGRNDWQSQWLTVAKHAAKHDKQLVAVIYADWQHVAAPAPKEVLDLAQKAGCEYVLVDTFDKTAGSTFDHLSAQELEKILTAVREAGMSTVVAGSLSLDLLQLLPLDVVDIVAVRGAVCPSDRTTQVDAGLVATFRQALAARFSTAPIQRAAWPTSTVAN